MGKNTLTRLLQGQGVNFGDYINPDEIAASSSVGSYEQRVRAAQRMADTLREDSIASRRDFAFETVMSHPSKIELMRQARDAGFHVTLFFVGTEDPRINFARVDARVELGGHPVPEELILSRYRRTMTLLEEAALTANRTVVFDNSRTGRQAMLKPVVELREAEVASEEDCRRLSDVVAKEIIAAHQVVPHWVWLNLLFELLTRIGRSETPLGYALRFFP